MATITLNIPLNDYKKPTKVRQNVVQAICDYFLNGSIWHEAYFLCFNPITKTLTNNYDYFCHDKRFLHPNELEVQTAFNALIEAGYHFFLCVTLGEGMKYICSKKDYYKDENNQLWGEVKAFEIKLD